MKKMFGTLAALLQEFLMATQEVVKAKPAEGLLEWLLTKKGQEAIKKACEAGWAVLIECQNEAHKWLESIGTISVPATTLKFVAPIDFVGHINHEGSVKIGHLDENFVSWFLTGNGKVEDLRGDTTLKYAKLGSSLGDDYSRLSYAFLFEKLEGDVKAETSLNEIHYLMKEHPELLRNNGFSSWFFVRDTEGVLRSLMVYSRGDDWGVRASSLEDSSGWNSGGDQVFSH